METLSNLRTGYIFDAVPDSEVNHDNILKELKSAKEFDSEPFLLTRGNIFNNKKARTGFPNDVVIFEIVFPDPDEYPAGFRGFLFPDGSVNGKFKYSLDAKCPDEPFNGIYKINKKGVLVMFGQWRMDGKQGAYFIELSKISVGNKVGKHKTKKESLITKKDIKRKNILPTIKEEILNYKECKKFHLPFDSGLNYTHVIYIDGEEIITIFHESSNKKSELPLINFKSKLKKFNPASYQDTLYFLSAFSWFVPSKKQFFNRNPFLLKKFKPSPILNNILSNTKGNLVYVEQLSAIINMITGCGFSRANKMAREYHSSKKINEKVNKLMYYDGRTLEEIINERMVQTSLRNPAHRGAYHLHQLKTIT